MPLSDAKVRNAKPRAKPYKIADGEGLFLLVIPAGGKRWRMKYRFGGREKLLSFGVYPEVSLMDARERRLQARKILAAGNDPAEVKMAFKRRIAADANNTFETIAGEWMEKQAGEWGEKTARKAKRRMELHLFPELGFRPVSEIAAPELLAVLRTIEKKGTVDTARRCKQYCERIFAYAIITSRAKNNPARDLEGALKTKSSKHRAYLKEGELPEFFEVFKEFTGEVETKLALWLLILTFVRTGELRGAEWVEFDLDKAEWRIPPERMKMKDPHIVPLSRQAVIFLKELQKRTGYQRYLFPKAHSHGTCMSENTMLYALYDMGFKYRTTGHGFRSTASTILNENGFMPDVIERQLAHTEHNQVRAAYNHAQYLPERRKMMQWWADYIDGVARKN